MAALADWRNTDQLIAVRCMTGRAGSGKTRVGIEACELAETDGWLAGFITGDELRRFHAAANLSEWRSPKDTLVIVDDAAAAAAIVKDWLTALARRKEGAKDRKLRILLLERYAEADSDFGWWADLKRSDSLALAGAGDLIGSERPVMLPVIAAAEDRRALLAEAMCLAGGFMGKEQLAPPAAGVNPDFDRKLADDRLENEPLFLVMAGIVAVERGAPAALALARTELGREMAGLERGRLARLGVSHGLPADGNLIAHCAACLTMQRGATLAAALAMVKEEVAAMEFSSPLSSEQLVALLNDALPGPANDRLDRVRPDLIGEFFFVREVTGPPLRSAATRQEIIERAHDRDEAVVEALVLAAQDLASGEADHPSVSWLSELTGHSTRLDELMRIANGIPRNTLALRELGLTVHERIALLLRKIPGEPMKPILATSLMNLASRHSDLGQREPALAAAREAVGIYRGLAKAEPEAFRGLLAASLELLSVTLDDVGEVDPALAAAQESVEIFRSLAEADSRNYLPSLASSLHTLANRLMTSDQPQEALEAAQESVDLTRTFAAERPDLFMPNLAMALGNLSSRMSGLELAEPALGAGQECVALFRTLAAAYADAHMPDLAMGLSNLANRWRSVGKPDKAKAVAEEAVGLYRKLAKRMPAAYMPELSRTLSILGDALEDLGQSEEAVQMDLESVSVLAPYYLASPAAFERAIFTYMGDYLRRAQAYGIAFDADLVQRIAEKWDETMKGEKNAD